jgi:hypothetical protein
MKRWAALAVGRALVLPHTKTCASRLTLLSRVSRGLTIALIICRFDPIRWLAYHVVANFRAIELTLAQIRR